MAAVQHVVDAKRLLKARAVDAEALHDAVLVLLHGCALIVDAGSVEVGLVFIRQCRAPEFEDVVAVVAWMGIPIGPTHADLVE